MRVCCFFLRRYDKSHPNTRETRFTKVVFRGYMDSSFSTPEIRGETNEHLGILGPLIKAEVGQSIMVRLSCYWLESLWSITIY